MNTRKLASTVHITIAVCQLVYIYTPLHEWQYGLPIVQWVTFPLLLLSGGWLIVGRQLYGAKKAQGNCQIR